MPTEQTKPADQPAAEPTPDFDPATEPDAAKVEAPGLTTAAALMVQSENDKLHSDLAAAQERIDQLQRELVPPDVPAYDHQAAGTGHLEERLARVTAAMSRIPKRGHNTQQNYMFVAHSDVLDAVRPALAAEGVSFKSEMKAVAQVPEERQTQGGMTWFMWRVDFLFTLSCWCADEREQQVVSWSGWAQDYSDKGGSKAMTAAVKTFLIQQFLVSTGDDPDEAPTDTSSQAKPRQQQRQGNGDQVAADVRQLRHTALDYNQQLPKGVLGKIAKKVCGNGVVIKIEDAATLKRIVSIAQAYVDDPAAGQAWLDGKEPAPADADTDPADAARQAAAEAPDVPVELPPLDSYDPPLTPDERRQYDLGLHPRVPMEADE
jgi:hypothetical protein